ncbi:MAG: hypothetical protein JETT_1731 [Candidatus Jettenia ecosi]|uniref:Major facilitator superfamily (MFS) profile domain-containing protein n=1 Tax=Candidatus Jettenia ecosi TaxID=2494326 RepID=A0A533QBH9_9BACT|nr:MAG: hypothetical protein JETT_1731 [Candidatus Jettenia ecosi]
MSRAEISFAFSLASLSAILCAPFVGRFFDRFGACKIITYSMLIFSLCFISLYFLLPNLRHLYILYFILGAPAREQHQYHTQMEYLTGSK